MNGQDDDSRKPDPVRLITAVPLGDDRLDVMMAKFTRQFLGQQDAVLMDFINIYRRAPRYMVAVYPLEIGGDILTLAVDDPHEYQTGGMQCTVQPLDARLRGWIDEFVELYGIDPDRKVFRSELIEHVKLRKRQAEARDLGVPPEENRNPGYALDRDPQLTPEQWEERRRRCTPDTVGFTQPPTHYAAEEGKHEVIDEIRLYMRELAHLFSWRGVGERNTIADRMFIGFCMGNYKKYLERAGKKGSEVEDKLKAEWYRRMAEHVRGVGEDPRTDRPGWEPTIDWRKE